MAPVSLLLMNESKDYELCFRRHKEPLSRAIVSGSAGRQREGNYGSAYPLVACRTQVIDAFL
jgi:hypothetical protein